MLFFFIIIFLLSISLHEYAHGWVAYKLGDPGPKTSNRLTLNPFAHIEPFGTIILPLLLLFLSIRLIGQPVFLGYAKPAYINPYHFKNPKRDTQLVNIAGPLANIIIALVLILILRINIPLISSVAKGGIIINLMLAFFNLIPIPPLDCSKIVASALPSHLSYHYLKIGNYGLPIAILFMTRLYGLIVVPLAKLIVNLFKIDIII